MRIIPAIDLIGGKCVRLTQGDYQKKKIYSENPMEVARQFEDAGIGYLHLVDLDGAKSGKIINAKVLEKIATHTKLKIDFGGGVKSDEDLRIAFEAGAQQVTAGSVAVDNPELVTGWIRKYGGERIILGADVIGNRIATHAWQKASEWDLFNFFEAYLAKGIRYTICTDVSKDGMLEGPAIALYREILSRSSVSLIASGGVSSIDDVKQLQRIGCEGVIIGKAIYENKITLKELADLC
ncbi:MAG TPA: 1-(5-phosphoribosyl)-5-[(5-phosphoribosylamino)methylideneamino]imidazole-4-carboxamide isomerase [Ginsengibacter sp.]|nr:1-(5-phosphoribosyl)-5-[(5-phosphoribosylamino)methylideneamino]imidazole-4-carboxamide isomerase [Ginsengibacter sp.]HRP16959.1 1-(5-phosphoribosyl)-5-[(5-phosphoribosylamino)methylideneamino]imidazole-4-carboxamide isomerase [Ginsengibacter sp.]HRP43790.1 1-(5-phosphoribosyl)-5-[(5-phosphoribosylamino)methylideneamino]imidazole-4-carboxamide isomerase [Ginsengibacter sp.]